MGNTTAVKDANGNTTSYAYDSRNRLTTITDALGHTTVYGYNADGNQQTGDRRPGPHGDDAVRRRQPRHDDDQPAGGTTTMAYDAAGREISLTDPVGNTTQWTYDANDRMTP